MTTLRAAMDALELKHQYQILRDDELLRLWADKEGLTEVALSVLSEEISKRELLRDPQSLGRVTELKQELAHDQKRFERHQKRVVRRGQIFLIVFAVMFLFTVVKILSENTAQSVTSTLLPLCLILVILALPGYLIVRSVKKGKEAGTELVGIQGWLWWFVYIFMGFGGIIYNAFLALSYLSKHDQFSAIVSGILIAIALRAVMLLHNLDSRGLLWSRVYLLIVFGSGALMLIAKDMQGVNHMLVSIAWFGYLFWSRRVRNTFYREQADDKKPQQMAAAADDYKPFPDVR